MEELSTGSPNEAGFAEFDPTFDETNPAIRQGDVIQLVAAPAADLASEWDEHLGVVITANCDLTYGKHGGLLSYVPIVPVPVYLRLSLYPRILDSLASEARGEVVNALEGAEEAPSAERFFELIELDEDLDALVADLSRTAERWVRSAELIVAAQRDYQTDWDFEVATRHMDSVYARLRTVSGKPAQEPGVQLSKELRNRLSKQLPGDCYFLGQPAESFAGGYIAYLRLVRTVSHDSVATSAVHERKLGDRVHARRVGRLNVLYLHRLTQQMAQVFTDIGLPSAYEAARSELVNEGVSNWIAAIQNREDQA